MNTQKESLKKTYEKVCDENESRSRRKKRWAPKIFFDGRKSL